MVEYIGDPDMFKIILKSTDRIQGIERTTRALDVVGLGVVVYITTQKGDRYVDTTEFIPGAQLTNTEGIWTITMIPVAPAEPV